MVVVVLVVVLHGREVLWRQGQKGQDKEDRRMFGVIRRYHGATGRSVSSS